MMPKKRTRITEEQKVHEAWYAEARDVGSPEQLKDFVAKLVDEYEHDYGTVVHACAAAAIAAAWTISRCNYGGGITGFQAGCVMWSFLKHWLHENGPMRLLKYENMLFPQYEEDFDKTLSKGAWDEVQQMAKKNLAEDRGHPEVRAHWQSIVDGNVPFGYRVSER